MPRASTSKRTQPPAPAMPLPDAQPPAPAMPLPDAQPPAPASRYEWTPADVAQHIQEVPPAKPPRQAWQAIKTAMEALMPELKSEPPVLSPAWKRDAARVMGMVPGLNPQIRKHDEDQLATMTLKRKAGLRPMDPTPVAMLSEIQAACPPLTDEESELADACLAISHGLRRLIEGGIAIDDVPKIRDLFQSTLNRTLAAGDPQQVAQDGPQQGDGAVAKGTSPIDLSQVPRKFAEAITEAEKARGWMTHAEMCSLLAVGPRTKPGAALRSRLYREKADHAVVTAPVNDSGQVFYTINARFKRIVGGFFRTTRTFQPPP